MELRFSEEALLVNTLGMPIFETGLENLLFRYGVSGELTISFQDFNFGIPTHGW